MGYKTYTCSIAKGCGSCEWLAVPYPIQLSRKQAAVEALLEEMAEADGVEIEAIRGMDADGGEPLAFRHKAATPFAPGSHGRVRCGFYSAGTHHIVPCHECLAEDPRCRPILNAVARAAERLRIRAYDEDKGTGLLRHAIVRTAYHGEEALLTIVTNGDTIPHLESFLGSLLEADANLTSVVQNVNTRKTNAMLGSKSKALYGPGTMHDSLLGCTFEIGPTTFYQTNPRQTEVLYALAIEAAGLEGGMRLLDAYCGAGTIGICAASSCEGVEVVGVERGTEAVMNARRNAQANGIAERSRFVCEDAARFLTKAAAKGESYDVVLLDPPRAGSSEEFLDSVCAVGPKRVTYVSCNPETLARDIAYLRARGWRLERVAPVDMFGHTKHVETVCCLCRQ